MTEREVECIYAEKQCDGIVDCVSGEDEHYCECELNLPPSYLQCLIN